MQRNALCRSRRELSNEYYLAKFGLDTAENEPSQVCPTERPTDGREPRAAACCNLAAQPAAHDAMRSRFLVAPPELQNLRIQRLKIALGRIVHAVEIRSDLLVNPGRTNPDLIVCLGVLGGGVLGGLHWYNFVHRQFVNIAKIVKFQFH